MKALLDRAAKFLSDQAPLEDDASTERVIRLLATFAKLEQNTFVAIADPYIEALETDLAEAEAKLKALEALIDRWREIPSTPNHRCHGECADQLERILAP